MTLINTNVLYFWFEFLRFCLLLWIISCIYSCAWLRNYVCWHLTVGSMIKKISVCCFCSPYLFLMLKMRPRVFTHTIWLRKIWRKKKYNPSCRSIPPPQKQVFKLYSVVDQKKKKLYSVSRLCFVPFPLFCTLWSAWHILCHSMTFN